MIRLNRTQAGPFSRFLLPLFCLGALIFVILLSSAQAYPMSQQGLRPVPTADAQPVSDKATQSIHSASSGAGRFLIAGAPPTISVGAFLGLVGLETPAFETKCQECCRKTIKALGNTLHVLRSCGNCKLNTNVKATGSCVDKPLGFANNPSRCFAERCSAMLTAARPGCFCVGS